MTTAMAVKEIRLLKVFPNNKGTAGLGAQLVTSVAERLLSADNRNPYLDGRLSFFPSACGFVVNADDIATGTGYAFRFPYEMRVVGEACRRDENGGVGRPIDSSGIALGKRAAFFTFENVGRDHCEWFRSTVSLATDLIRAGYRGRLTLRSGDMPDNAEVVSIHVGYAVVVSLRWVGHETLVAQIRDFCLGNGLVESDEEIDLRPG